MNISVINTNKRKYHAVLSLSVAIGCFLLLGTGCSKKANKSSGRILSIDLPKNSFRPGETLNAHVRIRNEGQEKAHFLVVVNIMYGDLSVYDSHHGKKSHSHEGDECLDIWINPNSEQKIGPFVYQIPNDAILGTYHVLVGLREYPWEPLIMFCGAQWCPPETTFELRK